jgi:VWFA-related protein
MRLKAIPVRKTLALALLTVCTTIFLTAQDFQIRTRVDLVVVPVSVKTDGSRLIAGLTKDDFALYEDGQKQNISVFSTDPVPISAAILVDTGVSENTFRKVRSTFPALAEAFSDFDEVSVYRFDKFVTKLLDFTGDRVLVGTTLQTLTEPSPARNSAIGSGPFSANGPVINGVPVIPGGPEPGVHVSSQGTKLLHDAIFTAADALATRKADRRRIILIVSDGQTKGDQHSFDEAVNRLLDVGIEVYAVGMDQAFLSRHFSVLSSYAEQTGGGACFLNGARAMEDCYAQSTEEARNQYVLAYISTNKPAGDVRVFREINVEATSRNLKVHHRKGYFQYP